MNLIEESFVRLFPEKEFKYKTEIEYNRRLAPFNANIKWDYRTIRVNMNLQWKKIDSEIKIGLIQHLLVRLFKKKNSTTNIDLYNNFIRNVDLMAPKNNFDPVLEKSFNRLNQQFFFGLMEKPNLVWGRESFRKLACYNFHNDTVTMSTIFNDVRPEVLDQVMYHELLHKHFKFEHNNGRNSYHGPKFREEERKFPKFHAIEKEIGQLVRSKKRASTIRKKKKAKGLTSGLIRFFR